jgi:hypothetical protein
MGELLRYATLVQKACFGLTPDFRFDFPADR